MSKFDKIFEVRDSANSPAKPEPKKEDLSKLLEKNKISQNIQEPNEVTSNKRGRPKAKRSNPDFIGFTTYIRKETHLNVKIEILKEGNNRELSELVEELLSTWLNHKK